MMMIMMMMMRCLMSFRSEENYGVRGKGWKRKKEEKKELPASKGGVCLPLPTAVAFPRLWLLVPAAFLGEVWM